jgi:hypothetical protein
MGALKYIKVPFMKREYSTWYSMVHRCLDKTHPNYRDYGERGITVCEEWKNDYQQFVLDMGNKPAGLTLDRKDNSKGYYKGNCRWATYYQQSRNRRSTIIAEIDGITKCAKDWAIDKNINLSTLYDRVEKGYSLEKAISMGAFHKTKIVINGIGKTIDEWATETGINRTTIYMRIHALGWSNERAITNTKSRKSVHECMLNLVRKIIS